MNFIQPRIILSNKQKSRANKIIDDCSSDGSHSFNEISELSIGKIDSLRRRNTTRHIRLAALLHVLTALVDAWSEEPHRSPKFKMLVVASISYLSLSADVIPDWTPDGYEDDIWVMNKCMKQLKKKDMSLYRAITDEVDELVQKWSTPNV